MDYTDLMSSSFYHLMDTEWRKIPFTNMFEVMILQNMYFFGQ